MEALKHILDPCSQTPDITDDHEDKKYIDYEVFELKIDLLFMKKFIFYNIFWQIFSRT